MNHRELPIFKKAEQIMHLVNAFVEIVNESDNDLIKFQTEFLLENSMMIPAKISGAEGADIYDLRMENAAIIRKAAREIYVTVGSFEFLGLEDTDYIHLIRKEIDEFKILFRNWVKAFDPWNYILDDWGLFNPPGIEYEEDTD